MFSPLNVVRRALLAFGIRHFALGTRWRRVTVAAVLLLGIAAPLAAQGIPLPRLAIFFTARQGRWTLLTSWTLIFATQNRTGLAISAADHALKVAERSADERKIATSLHYLALLHETAGDAEGAESCARRALAIRERTLGVEDQAVADELIRLARLATGRRRFDEAAPLLTRALAIRQQHPAAPGPIVDALDDYADLLAVQRRFQEAEVVYRRALKMAEEQLGPDDPALASSLTGLAATLRDTDRPRDAEPLYRRALDLGTRLLGGDDPIATPILEELATALERQGRSEEAAAARARAAAITARVLGSGLSASARQKRWEKLVAESMSLFGQAEYGALVRSGRTALESAEALFGPRDYRVSVFLVLLGAQTGGGEADYGRAEALFRRAVRIAERAVGTEDAGLAEALLNFAGLYRAELKEREAEAALLRAVGIHERIMGLQTSEDPLMHSPRIQLAALYQQQGRFDEAEALLQRALAAIEKGTGPTAPRNFATSQLLMALVYLREQQGRYADAEPLIRRAVDLASSTWGLGWGKVKNAAIASFLSDLAFVYIQQGRYADAERTDLRIIELRRKAGGRGGDLYARAALADVYERQGQHAKAEVTMQDVLRRAEQLRLPWHMRNAAMTLSYIQFEQRKYAEAESLIRQELKIEQDAMAADSPIIGATLFGLALAVAGQGRSAEAEPLFDRSFANLRRQLQFFFTYMSESDRLKVLDNVAYRFAAYFSFADRVHQADPATAGRMYDLVLWHKGLVVRSIEALRRRIANAGDPAALALVDELAARRAQLAAAMAEPTAGSAASRARLARLQQQANDVERRLVDRSQAFVDDRQQQNATWRDVRGRLAALGADAAVEFVRFRVYDGVKPTPEYRYVALVLTRASEQPLLVRLVDAARVEDASVQGYLQTLTRGAGEPSASVIVAADSFYDAFWKPIEAAIGPARRIYVATDGVLNQMAIGLTPVADGRLLMDAYDLRLVNSTADLLQPPREGEGRNALLVGNPRFKLDAAEHRAAVASLDDPAHALPAA
ncbi:MAG: hypothetical protein DMF86_24290, partial [Acidobacteria bacterium]